jgi:ADP-ribose pyrophosphatase YjhB (NUDIX family)
MTPRLAVRAIILHDRRLLLVNAYADRRHDLWCAPGGGVEVGSALPDNMIREVAEETGLIIRPGPLALVNEFHDPPSGFHQVDLFFRAEITGGRLDPGHADPEGVVSERRFFAREELASLRIKPDSLIAVAWGDPDAPAVYDPLERMVR